MSTTKDGETGGNTKHGIHRSKFDALPPNLIPLGLRREAAAAYWSVSPSAFDKLVAKGLAPKPIPNLLTGMKLWDRRQLDRQRAGLLPSSGAYKDQAARESRHARVSARTGSGESRCAEACR